jgi:hypothetical protein
MSPIYAGGATKTGVDAEPGLACSKTTINQSTDETPSHDVTEQGMQIDLNLEVEKGLSPTLCPDRNPLHMTLVGRIMSKRILTTKNRVN